MEMVKESLESRRAQVSLAAEFYIVDLLRRLQKPDSMESYVEISSQEKPITILLLEALQAAHEVKLRRLKAIAESTLVLSGMFAESLRGGVVNPSYYFSVGTAAYKNLSSACDGSEYFSELYMELSGKFALFAKVLSDVAPWNKASGPIDLVRLYERWQKTGDERIRAALVEKGIKV